MKFWISALSLFLFPILALADGSTSVCANLDLTATPASCTGSNCLKNDRILIACQMKKEISDRYASYWIKEQRIFNKDDSAFNTEDHLEHCVRREQKRDDEKSAISFLDRMRECVAGFQDTHFSFHPDFSVPTVFTAIQIGEQNGRYFITGVRHDLLQKLGLDGTLHVGLEVRRIDGKHPRKLVEKLLPFIGGSSPDYRNLMAVRAIFDRSYFLPSTTSVQIETEAGTFDLPYFLAPIQSKRTDVNQWISSSGLSSAPISSLDGYSNTDPLPGATTTSFEGFSQPNPDGSRSDEGTAIRTGNIAIAGENLCYLEILHFNADVVQQSGSTLNVHYAQALGSFLANCKNSKQELVLDLRANPGGFTSGSTISALSPSGQPNPGFFLSYRVTPAQLAYSQKLAYQPMIDLFQNAIAAHNNFTAMEIYGPLASSSGFDGKIYALVTPECISDCDIVSAALKTAKRATFIGSHTNGTGAGMFGNYQWNSPELFSISFPTSLFGIAPVGAKTGDALDLNLVTEDRPTTADIQVSSEKNTLTGDGWIDAIASARGK